MCLALSPVFVAALANAKTPLDVIVNACKLRESKHAQEFRAEVAKLSHNSQTDSAATELWKARIRDRIANLNDFLLEKGESSKYIRSWWARLGWGIPLGWQYSWRKERREFLHSGDASVLFFSDLMRQAIGVIESQRRISEVFGVSSSYDMPLISCASPNFQRRKDAQRGKAQ